MKLRKLWIPALILTLIGGAAKICDTVFNVNGSGFFLNTFTCNTIFTAAFILLFVIGYGLSIADRKKKFNAQVRKDVLCGIFGFIASVMIIATGVVTLLALDGSKIAECIFAIAGGGILLYESCISFTGQNGMKKIPVAGLLLPIWCCMRFISLFSVYNQTSLYATELFDIVAVAFLLMFLFYQSMFFAGVNNSVATRKLVAYGTVFVMLDIVVTIDLVIKMIFPAQAKANIDTQIVTPSLINIMTYIGDIALCVYAMLFMKDALKSAESTLTDEDDDDFAEEEALYGEGEQKETSEEESDENDTSEKPADILPEVESEDKPAEEKTIEFDSLKEEPKPEKKEAPKAAKPEPKPEKKEAPKVAKPEPKPEKKEAPKAAKPKPEKKEAPKAAKPEPKPEKKEAPKAEKPANSEPVSSDGIAEDKTYDELMQMLDDLRDE